MQDDRRETRTVVVSSQRNEAKMGAWHPQKWDMEFILFCKVKQMVTF